MVGINHASMEGFAQDAFSWDNLLQAVMTRSGSRWFSDYPEATISDLRSAFPHVASLASTIPFAEEWSVRAPFGPMMADGDVWGLPADSMTYFPWRTQPVGTRVLGLLDTLGLRYEITDEGRALNCYFAIGQGVTKQTALLCATASGQAVLDWSTCILTSDSDFVDATAVQLQSRYFHVPAVLQAAMFVAENPFPTTSSLVQVGRGVAFPDVDSRLRPRPGLGVLTNTHLDIPRLSGMTVTSHLMSDIPSSFYAGYAIDTNLSDSSLSHVLQTVVLSLAKVHLPLLDGWHHAPIGSDAPFEVLLLAGSAVGAGEDEFLPFLAIPEEFSLT